jgi:serine/threonine protein kinase
MAANPVTVNLTVLKGPEKGRVFEFSEPCGFIAGRGTDAGLRLAQDDPYVSRHHVYLEICPPTCRLRDIGKTNPAQVNGEEFVERDLVDGDVIEVGYTQLKVAIQFPETGQRHACSKCGAEIELLAGEPIPDCCAFCREAEASRRASSGRATLQEVCARCKADLTPQANSDGRAADLHGVAVYLCGACCDECFPGGSGKIESVGGYEIRGRLGEGGMGVVSRAYHRSTARMFVLKQIKDVKDKLLARRFDREIHLLRGLIHPNIVRYVDSGIDPIGAPFLVGEFLPNGSLQDFMTAAGGRVRPEVAMRFISQVLEGLEYIHGQSIIHRDIKPSNILIGRQAEQEGSTSPIAKLTDFGLAVSYARAGGTRLTKPGVGLGTLMFVPPEQITDAGNVREPADTYAVGVTLYYLLTGRYTFDFPTPTEIRAFQEQNRNVQNNPQGALQALMQLRRIMHPFQIILEEPPIPIRDRDPSITAPLATVVDRAVRKVACERFQKAQIFRSALEGASNGL